MTTCSIFVGYFELDGDSTTVSITVKASSEVDGHPGPHALRYSTSGGRYWMPWETDTKLKLVVKFSPTVQICQVSLCVLHVRKVIVKCGNNKEVIIKSLFYMLESQSS